MGNILLKIHNYLYKNHQEGVQVPKNAFTDIQNKFIQVLFLLANLVRVVS